MVSLYVGSTLNTSGNEYDRYICACALLYDHDNGALLESTWNPHKRGRSFVLIDHSCAL